MENKVFKDFLALADEFTDEYKAALQVAKCEEVGKAKWTSKDSLF